MASGGDDVSVLCSRNRYDGGTGNRLPFRERIDGVEIRRCWGPNCGKRSLPGRVLDMSSFCISAFGRLLTAARVDTVLFLTNPPLIGFLGAWRRRLRKERFVYVLMDVYPDVAIRGGILRENGWVARALRRLARIPLEAADAVVVLGEDMKDVVIRQGAPAEKVTIIRNWADPAKVFPVPPDRNPLRAKWGLAGKFVVEYSGNFGISHDFADLLSAAEALRTDDGIRFLLIGDGVRRSEVEEFVTARKLPNVLLLPYQDASSLAWSLSAGDIHYVSLRKGFEGLVVPSKAYGAMAAGRPIVYQGAETGEIARMVDRERIGFVVPPADRKSLLDRIVELYRNPETRRRQGERARRALEERYSAEIGLALYRKVLEGGT